MPASAAERRDEALRPPSPLLLLSEGRGLHEFASSIAFAPLLRLAPRGDGHPVLALPGFLAGDMSTYLMRRYLRALGYRAEGWELGRNIGGFYRMRSVLRARLARLRNETGEKVSLIGWSLGGVFARDLALQASDAVRSVITLGSPFARDLNASNARRLYEQVTGERASDARAEDLAAIGGDLPVPATSIYSKMDGVVNWRCSIAREGPRAENIEILLASHIGLGGNPAALWAIADRLAQKDGDFKPFARSARSRSPTAGSARGKRNERARAETHKRRRRLPLSGDAGDADACRQHGDLQAAGELSRRLLRGFQGADRLAPASGADVDVEAGAHAARSRQSELGRGRAVRSRPPHPPRRPARPA